MTTEAGRRSFLDESDRGGDRTRGLRIKSPLLYQLSYPVGGRELSDPDEVEGVPSTASGDEAWPAVGIAV